MKKEARRENDGMNLRVCRLTSVLSRLESECAKREMGEWRKNDIFAKVQHRHRHRSKLCDGCSDELFEIVVWMGICLETE